MRIMQDILAGTIGYLHCNNSNEETMRPLSNVTASVDRIDLVAKILPDRSVPRILIQ